MNRIIGLCSLLVASLTVAPVLGGVVLGEYRFEEGTVGAAATTVLDTSGAGNNGTASGAPIYRSAVPVNPIPQTNEPNNRSLEFDNSRTGFLSVDSEFVFNRPGDATLEFWINAPDQGHAAIFWGRPDDTDANRFHVYLSGSPDGVPQPGLTFGMDYREPDGTLHALGLPGQVAFTFLPDQWTHIAVTRTADTYSFYKDGVLQIQGVDPNPNLPTLDGWQLAGRSYYYHGLIDEIRMSEGALAPAEFLNARVAPEPSTFVVWGLLSAVGVALGLRQKIFAR